MSPSGSADVTIVKAAIFGFSKLPWIGPVPQEDPTSATRKATNKTESVFCHFSPLKNRMGAESQACGDREGDCWLKTNTHFSQSEVVCLSALVALAFPQQAETRGEATNLLLKSQN
jgi:hypothetical protein